MDVFGGGIRHGILNLKLENTNDLYRAYMPFVTGGGLFVPTRQDYVLGDEVFILLDMVGESEKTPLTGKVIWISPQDMSANLKQGIGVQLNEKHSELVGKIETQLAGLLESDKPTHTM